VPKPVLPKPPARAKVSPVNSVQTVLGTTPGPVNRTVIVLDPAHGGQDNGARLSDSLVEKDVDLAFAFKLRSLLQARGFTVLLTRDSDSPMQDADPGSQLTLDDRAGLSNHARAAACLLIHSTGSGTGVHLYHSELAATPGEAASLPWLTAQAAWVTQSQNLAAKLGQALTRGSIPLVSSAASVRPVDSLTCPALVVELAPRDSGDAETITDNDYQQSVAEALAGALVFWKNQYQPPAKMIPLEPTPLAGPVTAMGEQP
jgi:N-acetylmuramoyl-L-alanine amidase